MGMLHRQSPTCAPRGGADGHPCSAAGRAEPLPALPSALRGTGGHAPAGSSGVPATTGTSITTEGHNAQRVSQSASSTAHAWTDASHTCALGLKAGPVHWAAMRHRLSMCCRHWASAAGQRPWVCARGKQQPALSIGDAAGVQGPDRLLRSAAASGMSGHCRWPQCSDVRPRDACDASKIMRQPELGTSA